ncbi:11194_t:CDS:1, partial [Racocetra fulgida]
MVFVCAETIGFGRVIGELDNLVISPGEKFFHDPMLGSPMARMKPANEPSIGHSQQKILKSQVWF